MKKKLLLTSLLLVSGIAHSMEVFDPWNWIQTNQTAIAAVKTDINTASMLYNQALMYQNQLKQGIGTFVTNQVLQQSPQLANMYYSCGTATGGTNSSLNCASSIAGSANNLAMKDQQMLGALQKQQAYLNDTMADYGSSGKTFAQSMERQTVNGQSKMNDFIQTNESMNDQIAALEAQRIAIKERMPNIEGITDSINLTTTAIDNLTQVTMINTRLLKKDLEIRAADQANNLQNRSQYIQDRANYNQTLLK